jgi:predicted nucleotide-binding protein (sugar kinase/HSP70/actin superfamily)
MAALDAALGAQKKFRSRFERGIAKALRDAPADVRRVILIGRPYNTCDRALNLDLPKKLLDLGVLPVPMDALLTEGAPLSEDWDNMYWKYGQKILSAAEKLAGDVTFDAVYVTNFGCGPDSFLSGFFQRTIGNKPALLLEIDEHSADAGVITRLEAWLDSLANIKQKPNKRERLFPEIIIREDRTMYIPHMCEHAHPLAAAFRSVGIPSEALPPSDEESVQVGRRYTIGKECLPAIITTGDMVKKINEKGFRGDRAAFFMPSGTGPCRFGQYHKLHRLVLRDIGRTDVPVFAPTQGRNFYSEFKAITGDPTRPAWQGIVAVDLLQKTLHRIRPYEVKAGETDRVFQRCVERVCQAIEEGSDPLDAVKDSARDLLAVPIDSTRQNPIVGVVGEIYVRHNEAANNNVVRRLEALGLEVELASFCEWIYYTNFTRRRSAFIEKNFPDLFVTSAKDTVQRFDERRLGRPLKRFLRQPAEPPIRTLLDIAAPYIHESFEGEAILTIGKALELRREHASGIVNAMPFTCMPGTISAAILKRVHEESGLFPILNIAYDGQEDGTYQTRLEAFAHQVKQYHAARVGRPERAAAPNGALTR